jgi:hypothetical protein
MPFEPDIIVTAPDGSDVALVVEAKVSPRQLEESERQLKAYMASVRSPVGLLVTPEKLWLYRDRYLSSEDDSIAEVGAFDVKNVLRFRTTENFKADALAFERSVQAWLESLSTESGLRHLPPDLRRAAQMYIVPALAQGAVRSGHPRSEISV